MTDSRKLIVIATTLSLLALAALSVGVRVLQPFLIEIQQACQEQFTANAGESSALCERGPTTMIVTIQALTVFIGGYILLVRALKLLNVVQVAVIALLFLIASLVSEFGLPVPSSYITLPAETWKDWFFYYLFVSKEVVFMTLLAFLLVQPAIVRDRTKSVTKSPKKTTTTKKLVKKSSSKTSSSKKTTTKKS